MAQQPLLNTSQLTDADLQAVAQHLIAIDGLLSGKVPELTPEQRRNMGSVDEQNKLIINKVIAYLNSHPHIQPAGIDWRLFRSEVALRDGIEERLNQLRTDIYILESAKILHDQNCLNAAYAYYRYLEYLVSVQSGDAKIVHNDFKQLFKKYGARVARRNKKPSEDSNPETPSNP